MKRVIAILLLASCAHRPPARHASDDVQNALIATAVITGVMLLSLAVSCDSCNLDDATRLAR